MRLTLLSEWTKLRSQRGALIALAAMGLLMVGMCAFFASQSETDAAFGGDDDVVQLGLAGIVFAELAAVAFGASLITSEFSTGMFRTTLTATQGRLRVLVSKAVVLSVVAFPFALVATAVAFVLAESLLRDRGYTVPAYPHVSLGDGPALRAVIGTALLLTAYCLIALGIATIVRHAGAANAIGIGLLFMPILMLGALPDGVRERFEQLTPLAGMAIQSTTGRMLSNFDGTRGMPIGPWQGLGVAFAWAVGTLAVGYASMRRRDA